MSAADETVLSASLSESVLALLCFGGDRGQIAAGIVKAEHFEDPYSDIASRAIGYRHRYKRAPSIEHIDDLFDHVLSNPGNKRAAIYQRILLGLHKQSRGLNEDYVITRLTEFIRRQTYKQAIMQSVECYKRGADADVADEVEGILAAALRTRVDTMSPGLFMNDRSRVLSTMFDERVDGMRLGIPALDAVELGPTRRELMGLIAPRGKGKSMFLTHIEASVVYLNPGWRVMDISCEMREERKAIRILQNLYSIAKRNETYKQAILEVDQWGRLVEILIKEQVPASFMRDPGVFKMLSSEMTVEHWGAQLGSIVIKSFPSGKLTMSRLLSYLDYMDQVHHFIPDAINFDYPQLMALDPDHIRESLGWTIVQLRGLCDERNMAGTMVHQGTRSSEDARQVRGKHAAEDISMLATCDSVLTYSSTDEEHNIGLGRLFVEKHRNDRDHFEVLINQNYRAAQFHVASALANATYWEQLSAALSRAGAPSAQPAAPAHKNGMRKLPMLPIPPSGT